MHEILQEYGWAILAVLGGLLVVGAAGKVFGQEGEFAILMEAFGKAICG